MAKIEIGLSQGWTKGLVITFDDLSGSFKKDVSGELFCRQVHGADIHTLTEVDLRQTSPLADADGLVCDGDFLKRFGKMLCVFTADCVPLVYVDHENRKLGVVHAGWRGLAKGIHMLPFRDSGFDPKNTWVWIGPHIHQNSYEVGADVVEVFSKWKAHSKIFKLSEKSPGTDQKWLFSMAELLRMEFEATSVELIYDVEVDTFTERSFASYRRAQKVGSELKGARNISSIGWGA